MEVFIQMKRTFAVVSSLAMLFAFSPVGSASTELVKSESSKSVASVSQSGNGKSLASEITKLDKETLKANQKALKKQIDTLSRRAASIAAFSANKFV
jgi:cell division protein FtsB